MEYFNYTTGLTMTNEKFDKLFGGSPRKAETKISQREMDIAASIQRVTEEVVLRLSRTVQKELNADYLCLAGGVALNCVANGKIVREDIFKDIWIQPAAGDAGGALGAALAIWYEYHEQPRIVERVSSREVPWNVSMEYNVSASVESRNSAVSVAIPPVRRAPNDMMQGAYLGPRFEDGEIREYLDAIQGKYEYWPDTELIPRLAEILDNGNVVGWFQGRMEFGPRALGGRSIIGDPRNTKMQSVMNLKIKYRESFRPFAPSVLLDFWRASI